MNILLIKAVLILIGPTVLSALLLLFIHYDLKRCKMSQAGRVVLGDAIQPLDIK